ncbi:ABC-2 type transport system ATP-binding protein [Kitasatospora sp. MAA19]|uniref:ATP-binding cassette domain-containing protein n=1 Tax=Kitasatospora sp. MAA19 TaxID=3035090 RepID=UPI002474A4ED|nr:ATP-binding cassette domain-containing protein [Kitasatospora sp. MAA19]MDH6709968.1 ABC-2 type transport system ATP-binding protein [Kitasatospora sp. MAA19]
MIQITGLTKVYRKGVPPAVLDLTFDTRPGMVTALLGAEDAGKSTALRLMLELERGQGVTLFDGRTYRQLRRPEREVGVLLPGPGPGAAAMAGHPGRKAHCHLRMLAAAVGVPARRADELLEQTRLAAVAGQRLRSFSPGMHRRLALAAALLGDPGTLLLDAPTDGLSPRNVEWFHSFLRSFGVAGGTVLVTTRTPQEAAQLADRVITLDRGRLVADQPVADFCRARLSPEVAVRGPQMSRLADLLVSQGAEVRRDGGAGLAVAGIDRTEIGELAYRHGILLHELADRVVEQSAPRAALPVASGRSGHLRVQPALAASEPAPEPAAEPALESTPDAPAVTVPHHRDGQHRDGRHRDGQHQDSRHRDELALPTRALPVTSVTTALAALGPAPHRADPADSGPTVAVERLFRDGPGVPARSALVAGPAALAPAASAGEPAPALVAGRRGSAAADLSTDDTVRLGRLAQATAASPAPATPDDHRSE